MAFQVLADETVPLPLSYLMPCTQLFNPSTFFVTFGHARLMPGWDPLDQLLLLLPLGLPRASSCHHPGPRHMSHPWTPPLNTMPKVAMCLQSTCAEHEHCLKFSYWTPGEVCSLLSPSATVSACPGHGHLPCALPHLAGRAVRGASGSPEMFSADEEGSSVRTRTLSVWLISLLQCLAHA